MAQRVLSSADVDGELVRLVLQVIGVIVMTIAIGLLVPFTESPDDRPRRPPSSPSIH